MSAHRLEIRTVAILEDGCFSVLLWDGRPFANSVERTFEDQRVVVSAGMILTQRDFYHKGNYATYELQISGHDRVLFHKGNIEDHSEACVIIGESFGQLSGKTAVLDSKGGFEEFMRLAEGIKEFYTLVSGR